MIKEIYVPGKRVRILDIHPLDGHNGNRDTIIGTIGMFWEDHDYDKEDYPEAGFIFGYYEPETPINVSYENSANHTKDSFLFYAVKLEEIE